MYIYIHVYINLNVICLAPSAEVAWPSATDPGDFVRRHLSIPHRSMVEKQDSKTRGKTIEP